MQWSDAIKPPSQRMLRQFAMLWLIAFGGVAAWRVWGGVHDAWALLAGLLSIIIGGAGIARPSLVRWIYSAWMIVAFPIGWTITQIVLAMIYFGLFTPLALIFRAVGRDALAIKRRRGNSHWTSRPSSASATDYLREY